LVVSTLGASGLLLFIVANRHLNHQRFTLGVAGALIVAAGLWWIVSVSSIRPAVLPPGSAALEGGPGPWLIAAAVVLAAGAWLSSGTGVYTRLNVVLWLSAVAAWLVAWWPNTRRRRRLSLAPSTALVLIALVMVTGLAASFLFHSLHSVPGEPTSDHAEKLLDVRDVLSGQHPIFFPRNTGREPAQFYLSAALIKWFGFALSWQTLKFGTALIGLLAVPAIFLVGRELAGSVCGLSAAVLAAVSKWPLGIDRMGLRFPFAVLASALTLYFLLRYLRRGDRRDALCCGLAMAFGLHGYSSFRVLIVAVAAVFGLAILRHWHARNRAWRVALADAGLAYGTAFIASVPLMHFAIQHSDLVLGRQSSRLDASLGIGDTVSMLASNYWNAARAFNWTGDHGWTVAVVGQPFLDYLTGAALLAGCVSIVTLSCKWRSVAAIAIVLVAPVLLLSSALSLAFPDENPSPNRMGVAVPLVFSLAGLPVAVMLEAVRASARAPRGVRRRVILSLGTIALACGLALVAADNYDSYFHRYRGQYLASAENTYEIARAVNAEGVSVENTFLLTYPFWLDARLFSLALTGDFGWAETHTVDAGRPVPAHRTSGRVVYVLSSDDRARRNALQRRFPHGTYLPMSGGESGRDFALYVVAG
jgi:uncharacterized membrane protein